MPLRHDCPYRSEAGGADDILACDISFHPFHRLSPLSQTLTHFHRRLQAADGEPGAVQDPDLPEGSEAPADGPAGQGESATVSSAAQGAREAGIDTAEEAVSDGAQQLRRQEARHTPRLQRSVPKCKYADAFWDASSRTASTFPLRAASKWLT